MVNLSLSSEPSHSKWFLHFLEIILNWTSYSQTIFNTYMYMFQLTECDIPFQFVTMKRWGFGKSVWILNKLNGLTLAHSLFALNCNSMRWERNLLIVLYLCTPHSVTWCWLTTTRSNNEKLSNGFSFFIP